MIGNRELLIFGNSELELVDNVDFRENELDL